MPKSKILCIAVIGILFSVSLYAGKQKTIENKNGVITDLQYGYSLTAPDNWKVKAFDEPSVTRLFLSKKNYEVNRDVKALGGDFTIPEIWIYTRPDTIEPKAFLDQLNNLVQSHQSTDNIITKLNLGLTGEYLMMQETKLGNIPAIHALYKRNYTRELQGDPADPRYRAFGGRIARSEHDVHELYIFKHGPNLFVIQAYAEREFYTVNKDEFAKIIGTFKFTDSTDTTKAPTENMNK
jgi:hypothetical protein